MALSDNILKQRRATKINPQVQVAARNSGYYGTGFHVSSLDADTRKTISLYDRVARANGMTLPDATKDPGILSKGMEVWRTGEYAIGGLMAGVGVVEGVQKKISPSRVLGIADEETKLFSARGVLGLAADILLDPTTYLTFGFGASAKISTKVGSKVLNKSGKQLLVKATKQFGDEALARQMVASRIVKAGGEKYLDKGGLKFFGVELVSRQNMGAPFRAIPAGIESLENTVPMLGRVTQPTGEVLKSGKSLFDKAFRPMKHIYDAPITVRQSLEKQLPELVAQYGDAGAKRYIDRQVGQAMQIANNYTASFMGMAKASRNEITQFVKDMGRMSAKAEEVWGKDVAGPKIARLVETGGKSGVPEIDSILRVWGQRSGRMLKEARREGIGVGKIENFLPHVKTREFSKTVAQDAIGFSANPTKPLRVKGNFAKSRTWLKFLDPETGQATVSTAERMGLLPYWRPAEIKVLKEQIITLEKKNRTLFNALGKDIDELISKLGTKEISRLKTFGRLSGTKNKKNVGVIEYLISKDTAGLNQIRKSLVNREKKYDALFDEMIRIKNLGDLANGEISRLGDEFFDVVDVSKMTKEQQIAKNILDLPPHKTWYQDRNGKIFLPEQAPVDEINAEAMKLYGVQMFEEDAFRAMAVGGADQIRDIYMARFFNDIARNIGVPAEKLTQTVRNPVTRNVSTKTVFLPKVVDGMRYVPVKTPQLKGVLFPEPIAQHLDDYMKFLTNDEALSGFVGLYDNLLKFWKGSVTGLFPAFHTRNFMGGVFNNWLGGLKNPIRYQQAHKAIDMLDGYKKRVVDLGQEAAGEMPKMIVKTDLGDVDIIQELLEFERRGGRGQTGIFDVAQTVDEVKKRAASGKFNVSKFDPRSAMEIVEDRLRLPMYIDRRIKGDSADEAMKSVFKYHFDYAPEGLTDFERNFMKRIIPFYRWARGNIPLQIQEMVKQPGKFAAISKVVGDMDDGAFYLPNYVRDGINIKVSENDKKGVATWLYSTGLPIDDVNRLWAGSTTDTLKRFMGEYLSPFLKYPIEAASGYSFFFNEPINDRNYVYPFIESIPGLRAWLGVKSYETKDGRNVFVAIHPRRLHALESFLGRFYTTIGKVTTHEGDLYLDPKTALFELFTPSRIREFEISLEEQKRIREYLEQVGEDLIPTGDLRKFEKFYIPKDIERQLNEAARLRGLQADEDDD